MDVKLLVAYASKYGGTEKIARRLGDVLRSAGLSVDVLNVGVVSSVEPYQAFVLGSAVYMGRWRKEAAEFLEASANALSDRPVWLFSSGPTGEGDPVELMNGYRFPKDLEPIADRIHPRDIAFFHGELHIEKLSFAERMVVKGVKAPVGDFRDWQAIEAWGASIAAAIHAGNPEDPPPSRQALLDLMHSEWKALQDALDGIDPRQWTEPGYEGGLSAKDILAHLTAWERRMLDWLDASDRGLTPERPAPGMSWDDLDLLNRITFDENRYKTLEVVKLEAESTHAEAVRAVERMSEADLFDGARYAWREGDPMWHMIAANTWWHYREHREQIQARLRKGT